MMHVVNTVHMRTSRNKNAMPIMPVKRRPHINGPVHNKDRDMGMPVGSRIQFRPRRLHQIAALPRRPIPQPRMRSIEVSSLFSPPGIQHCETLKVAALTTA